MGRKLPDWRDSWAVICAQPGSRSMRSLCEDAGLLQLHTKPDCLAFFVYTKETRGQKGAIFMQALFNTFSQGSEGRDDCWKTFLEVV